MKITINTYCPFCARTHEVVVDANAYFRWQNGELAQDAFPDLDEKERELIISGTCSDCWDQIFSDEEEDEDEEDDCDYEMGFDPYMGCFTDDC